MSTSETIADTIQNAKTRVDTVVPTQALVNIVSKYIELEDDCETCLKYVAEDEAIEVVEHELDKIAFLLFGKDNYGLAQAAEKNGTFIRAEVTGDLRMSIPTVRYVLRSIVPQTYLGLGTVEVTCNPQDRIFGRDRETGFYERVRGRKVAPQSL